MTNGILDTLARRRVRDLAEERNQVGAGRARHHRLYHGFGHRQSLSVRIEMVVLSMEMGGMETVVARLTRGLSRRGHTVGVTCTQAVGVLGLALREEGFSVQLVPTPGKVTMVWPRRLRACLSRRRPDVVHCHSGVWLKAAVAARGTAVRGVVHTVHGLHDREPWHGPVLKRAAASLTDSIVAVSRPLQTYLQRIGIAGARISVIPNGVDTERFRPGAGGGGLRSRIGVAPDSPVVGHVARLSAVKNQQMLLHAFAEVVRRRPDAHLVLVGDGPMKRDLELLVAETGLGGSVHFLGEVGDTAPLYREFDVFALSSHAEGTSISIQEAMASGVSVVATSVGGNADLLDGGGCGALVPPGDTEAFAGEILRLLDDASLRARLGGAARARAERVYGGDTLFDAYEQVYEKSVRAGSGR